MTAAGAVYSVCASEMLAFQILTLFLRTSPSAAAELPRSPKPAARRPARLLS
jgi:hypothetical protein